MSLGQRGSVVAVDRDPIMACLAEANLNSCGANQFEVLCRPAEEIPLESFDAWHIDPDRRPSGRRSINVDNHVPATSELNQLLQRNPNGAIKLAPAAVLPAEWLGMAELEWIGHSRQCHQLVARFGKLAANPGLRRATILDRQGQLVTQIDGREEGQAELDPRVGRFLLEPHAAVLAARLDRRLALEHGCWQVSPLAAYYSSDACPAEPGFSTFEVIESLPFDMKRLKKALRARELSVVEVKKRGVDEDPARVLRKVRGTSGQDVTLILVGHRQGVTSVVARRVEPA